MKGKTVSSIPHAYGPTIKPKGWTPKGQEGFDNERAARPWLAERQDRTHIEKDKTLLMYGEIDRLRPMGKGGTGLEEHPGLRPMRHRVFARRQTSALAQRAAAAGFVVPEIVDRPGKQEGWILTVVAVGEGVTSVKVGDRIVVHHALAFDRGGILGDGICEVWADCESLPDKPVDDSDRARGAMGVIDAVLVED